MTDTGRTTTVSFRGDACVNGIGDREFQGLIGVQEKGPLHSASPKSSCQDHEETPLRKEGGLSPGFPSLSSASYLAGSPTASRLHNTYRSGPRLRLLILKDKRLALPERLLDQILRIDPQAQIRNSWNSVCEMLADNWSEAPDVILDISPDCSKAVRRIKELWVLRVTNNYSQRPIYFAIPKSSDLARTRFDIERFGAYFLPLVDASSRLQAETEQIRVMFGHLKRSLPTWLVVYEGCGITFQAVVYFLHRKRFIRVRGSGRQIAALAVFIKNNGLERSFSGWQKILADDPLFEPSGGCFTVPSIGTIKMYVHRDFPKSLQIAFDEYRSGFSAKRVVEIFDPGTHMTCCRIRGEWNASRK